MSRNVYLFRSCWLIHHIFWLRDYGEVDVIKNVEMWQKWETTSNFHVHLVFLEKAVAPGGELVVGLMGLLGVGQEEDETGGVKVIARPPTILRWRRNDAGLIEGKRK